MLRNVVQLLSLMQIQTCLVKHVVQTNLGQYDAGEDVPDNAGRAADAESDALHPENDVLETQKKLVSVNINGTLSSTTMAFFTMYWYIDLGQSTICSGIVFIRYKRYDIAATTYTHLSSSLCLPWPIILKGMFTIG